MVVASRTLKLYNGQEDIGVGVRVFTPEQDQNVWSAKYEIDWPEGTRTGAAKGIDSVQSLLSALKMIGAEIYTSDYHKSGNLLWTQLGRGYGFPVPQNIRDMLVGDDAGLF